MALKLKSVTIETADSEVELSPPEKVTSASTKKSSSGTMTLGDSARKRVVVGRTERPIRPPEGGLSVETVLGLDERTRIVSTDQAPWRLVCALEIDGPWGAFVGTGWFVAPKLLITAGHCVYDRNQMGGAAREITVTPGRSRGEKPFGTQKATRFSTVDLWRNDQNPDFDIGAIHLNKPFAGLNEVFQVASYSDDELMNFNVNISGYPANPGGGEEQWWARNRIRAVTPRRIFYDVDTSGGQSGAPAYVFEHENGPPIVIGIHAYGVGGTPASIPLRVNSAPRIIPEVVEQIQAWIDAESNDV
jgi:V8-like Glu-specific endopeptidase